MSISNLNSLNPLNAALDRDPAEFFRDIEWECPGGIILGGARGIVSDHARQGLRRMNRPLVAIVDNDSSLWGKAVDGVPVLPPSAAADYPTAIFVVAVFTHTPFREQLASLGAKHVVAYASLFHAYPDAFLPFFAVDRITHLRERLSGVREAADIWADQESSELYRQIH